MVDALGNCPFGQQVFAQLTSGHGSYQPSLELLDAEGQSVWREVWERPFEARDRGNIHGTRKDGFARAQATPLLARHHFFP